MKELHITEQRYFQFRWEMFNALNRQNLGLPNTNFCLPPGPNSLWLKYSKELAIKTFWL